MNLTVTKSRITKSNITIPGDKSIAHRALILCTLANGESIIRNIPDSKDINATLNCLKQLGVKLKRDKHNSIRIKPSPFKRPSAPLNTQNSGTAMRLLAGLVATQPFMSVLTGGWQLNKRPMARIIKPLRLMDALIMGKNKDTQAPLIIKGGMLKGKSHKMLIPSAQVKSALLIAGLKAKGITQIKESLPTRNHTENLLKAMGADIKISGLNIKLNPVNKLKPLDITLPGDISSAAYFIAAAILIPGAKIVIHNLGLNPRRIGFIEILRKMGAKIKISCLNQTYFEQIGTLEASYSGTLHATKIDGIILPSLIDEVPLLSVVATQAEGITTIRKAGELRFKESDRISAVVTELKHLKADIKELPDGLLIKGKSPLEGAVCSSHHDHRIAMSLAVAGLTAKGKTIIRNAECISKSFPTFGKQLKKITTKV
ncbi:MAG: 3-phosphoshikimate 1-carboxyvinyltransferase [Planctomycetes bacterium]|nr:3-phosphoshikimate 1-carboxyvinyltransferase [Planctomycetota bacterium]